MAKNRDHQLAQNCALTAGLTYYCDEEPKDCKKCGNFISLDVATEFHQKEMDEALATADQNRRAIAILKKKKAESALELFKVRSSERGSDREADIRNTFPAGSVVLYSPRGSDSIRLGVVFGWLPDKLDIYGPASNGNAIPKRADACNVKKILSEDEIMAHPKVEQIAKCLAKLKEDEKDL
jgi:hypothetical protein